MFPQNKITHLNKMQYIYYICSPALKCLSPKAAGKHGHLKGSAARFGDSGRSQTSSRGSSRSVDAIS